MLPFKITCIMGNIFPLHKTESMRCTKQKIYVAQNGKYEVHKTENTGYTKWKIYARQNRKYTLHKTESIRCTKENIRYTKENTDCRKRKIEHSSGLQSRKEPLENRKQLGKSWETKNSNHKLIVVFLKKAKMSTNGFYDELRAPFSA